MPIGGIPTYWNKILREQILLEEKKINIWDDLKYLNISREVDSDVRGNWFSCKIIILFV
jgi:hypothetical protein